MTNAQAILTVLGDPTRQAILDLLLEGPQPVGELAALLPVSRPAVSQHLKVLKEVGLVVDRQEGTRRVYRVDPAGPEEQVTINTLIERDYLRDPSLAADDDRWPTLRASHKTLAEAVEHVRTHAVADPRAVTIERERVAADKRTAKCCKRIGVGEIHHRGAVIQVGGEVDAQLLDDAARHLGDGDFQHHLVAALHHDAVDDLAVAGEPRRHVEGLLRLDRARQRAGQHDAVVHALDAQVGDECEWTVLADAQHVDPRQRFFLPAVMAPVGDRAGWALLGDEREQVGRWLGQFEATLVRQDGKEIAEARRQFAVALDTLERGPVW